MGFFGRGGGKCYFGFGACFLVVCFAVCGLWCGDGSRGIWRLRGLKTVFLDGGLEGF